LLHFPLINSKTAVVMAVMLSLSVRVGGNQMESWTDRERGWEKATELHAVYLGRTWPSL
jgi:hypothetical protein